MKKKKLPVKDLLEMFGIVTAIIISIIGLLQSNRSINIANNALSVNLVVQSKLIPKKFYSEGHYGDYLITRFLGLSPQTTDLCFDTLIQIDNLSQRDVSIRNISALALADDGQRYLGLAPNPEDAAVGESIGISQLSRETETELVDLNLPFLLKSGEAIDIHGAICLILSPETTAIMMSKEHINNSYDTSQTLETFLRDENILLGGACNSNDCVGFGIVSKTEPWHPLEINLTITTAFNTKHNTVLLIP